MKGDWGGGVSFACNRAYIVSISATTGSNSANTQGATVQMNSNQCKDMICNNLMTSLSMPRNLYSCTQVPLHDYTAMRMTTDSTLL